LFAARACRSQQAGIDLTLVLHDVECPRELSDDPVHAELRCITFCRMTKIRDLFASIIVKGVKSTGLAYG